MTITNTPFEEGLDEIFSIDTVNDLELPHWWVKEAKAALTKLHEAAVQEARLDENKQIMAASDYKDDTYSVRSYYFSRRIAALQKGNK